MEWRILRIHVGKIEKRDTFKIKTRYYFELLTTETMKLFGSTKSKMTQDENGKNLLHLEITEVLLVGFNFIDNDYQCDSRVFYNIKNMKNMCKIWKIIRWLV